LEHEGYDLLLCESASHANDILNNYKPDLLLFELAHCGLKTLGIWIQIYEKIMEWKETLFCFFTITNEQKQSLLHSHSEDEKIYLKQCLLENPFCVIDIQDSTLSQDTINEFQLRLHHTLALHDRYKDWQNSFYQLQRSHRSIRREMTDIWNIQRMFLNREFPNHPDFAIEACYHPSAQVGGDYYDVVQVDDDHWGLVMADIAGHGASAAVVMGLTQMTVKEFSSGIVKPGEALNRFNEKLNQHLHSQHFVTMFYAIFNRKTKELVYTSAGHCPPLWYSSRTNESTFLRSVPAFPLRTFQNHSYDEQSVILSPNDRLLFYTDGVTDLQNQQDNLYGVDRLREVFHQKQNLPIKELIHAIQHDTEAFRNNRERLDDFTLMLFELTSDSSANQ